MGGRVIELQNRQNRLVRGSLLVVFFFGQRKRNGKGWNGPSKMGSCLFLCVTDSDCYSERDEALASLVIKTPLKIEDGAIAFDWAFLD